jgi:hypothetical protein
MIVVRVELWSAITGRRSTLALMSIANSGESPNPNRGDYEAKTFVGRDEDALLKALNDDRVSKRAEIKNHARLQEHVWNLVGKALAGCGYKTV